MYSGGLVSVCQVRGAIIKKFCIKPQESLYLILLIEKILKSYYSRYMIIDNKYTIAYTVPPSFIDGKCRFTALGIAALAQDLAAGHYTSAGLSIPHLQKVNLTWVITKQHFEISEYPLWMDTLIAQTWAQPPKGPFCFRDFAYAYTENGKKASIDAAVKELGAGEYTEAFKEKREAHTRTGAPCMRGSSCWMLLNTQTGQIVKPDEKALGGMGFNGDHMEGKVFVKIAPKGAWDIEEHIKPSLLDIDLNSHVNNLTYLRWILSFMDADFCRQKLLRTLDTNFISSAQYGEQLICRCAQTDENICVHSIIRAEDKSEVFKARTEWAAESELSRTVKIS